MNTQKKQDRVRTNLLRKWEQQAIQYFCPRIPSWVTPNVLTAIGFSGSLIVGLGFWLGIEQRAFLLLAVAGLAVNWFGSVLVGHSQCEWCSAIRWMGDWLITAKRRASGSVFRWTSTSIGRQRASPHSGSIFICRNTNLWR